MRFLFVHQNFPAQYLHIVRHLSEAGEHEICFITEDNPNVLPGVRKITYNGPGPLQPETFGDVQEFEQATKRAHMVAQTAATLKGLGFTPDIIIGHHGWGELLNMHDVYPRVPLLGYYEFYYRSDSGDVNFDPEFPTPPILLPRVRAKNAVNLIALNNPGHGQTPTRFQQETYPGWARPGISRLAEGVNLDICCPDPAARTRRLVVGGLAIEPEDTLVTYVARDLEPYRGFHIFMRAIPRLLAARPDVKILLIGGDGVSYGARLVDQTWREYMLAETGALDPARVAFPGRVDYGMFVSLLQRSDVHVYLTYPFVASWSLREALACGCAIVASDTAPVHEFVQDGVTGVLTPCLDPALLAERVLELLDDPARAAVLRAGARQFAEQHLRMDDHLAGFEALISQLTGE